MPVYFRTELPQSICKQNTNPRGPSSFVKEAKGWEAPSGRPVAAQVRGHGLPELVETAAAPWPRSLASPAASCQLVSRPGSTDRLGRKGVHNGTGSTKNKKYGMKISAEVAIKKELGEILVG